MLNPNVLTVLHLSKVYLWGFSGGYSMENYAETFTFMGHEGSFLLSSQMSTSFFSLNIFRIYLYYLPF